MGRQRRRAGSRATGAASSATTVAGAGSAQANALALIPTGDGELPAGARVDALPL